MSEAVVDGPLTLEHRMRTPSRLAVVAAAAGSLLAVAGTAFAAHESNNSLVFAPVGASSTAVGSGTINYVKGASVEGDEEQTVWQQSLSFSGLTSGVAYSVVVKRAADADDTADNTPGASSNDRTICTFTATVEGTGACSGRFLELRALGNAQLQTGGRIVAQATRTPAEAPGSITSQGGNREK